MDYLQMRLAEAGVDDWLTILAYGIAAFLAWRARSRAVAHGEGREATFWCAASIVLLLLGINEFLDLQTLLTATGRSMAREQGWYRERREFQLWFMAVLSIAGVICAAIATWWFRASRPAVLGAMIGFALLGVFILLRAASFHHTDQFLQRGLEVFDFGAILETSGILVVALSALLYPRRVPVERKPRLGNPRR